MNKAERYQAIHPRWSRCRWHWCHIVTSWSKHTRLALLDEVVRMFIVQSREQLLGSRCTGSGDREEQSADEDDTVQERAVT